MAAPAFRHGPQQQQLSSGKCVAGIIRVHQAPCLEAAVSSYCGPAQAAQLATAVHMLVGQTAISMQHQ